MVVLREENETLRMRYEEDLLESKLLNTIKTIKTIVWEYAGDDVPKLRDHL